MTAQTHLPPTALDQTAPHEAPVVYPPTRWALAGLGAGLAGLAMMVSSSMVDAVYDEKIQGDAVAISERLGDQVPQMLAFHLSAMIGAVLMVVFAAGLFRRLRATTPADSVLPLVAFSGVLITAIMLVVGSGLDTEFIFAAGTDMVVPEDAAMFNHWIGTVPWCWGLLGLSGVALFGAARHGSVPKWLGLVGLLGGGLTLLLGISPLQYMAGMTGPVGLVVIAIGFLAGDKAFRGRS
ncbi:hypothetical protein KVF89_18120 [Nocardioides carbamazepini]|jgi:hypothetical protein|uniref:hypothetical protein n=1 Tax=Nocardioides carbamazepini TaxID=2854259 RepID=UPI00214A68BD|nr:hypothetical protein [Nocardioides carbamazepini]MCR1784465.1 hypothetical protein [Nocardioides carbamazepini]